MSSATAPRVALTGRPVAAALIATFVASLDNVVVTLALPALQADLGATTSSLAWTINAYTIPFAVLMLTATTLADHVGAVRVFRWGLVLFAVSSIGAALSTGLLGFALARAAQGCAAAAVVPLALALAVRGVGVERRTVTTAAVSAAQGLSAALGPFAGGAIVQLADWPWLFWINVPLCVLALTMTAGLTDPAASAPRPRLGLLGIGCAGLALLTSAALRLGEPEVAWASVVGQVVVGVALLALFWRLDRASTHPIVPRRLASSSGFGLATLAGLLVTAGIFGAIFVLVQYLQVGRGYGPLQAGLATLPWTLVPVVTAPLSPALAARWGVGRCVTLSAVVLAIGTAWIALLADATTPYALMVPGMVVAGAGMGGFFALTASQVLGFTTARDETRAVGLATSAREAGVLVGTATSAVLLGIVTGTHASSGELLVATRPVVLASLALVLVGAACAARAGDGRGGAVSAGS